MPERPIPQELLLVAACCRWPLSASVLAAIRTTAAHPIDWPSFLRLVRRHRVFGLVHNALAAAEIEVPAVIAGDLASRAEKYRRGAMLLAAETLRLQELFDANGITVAVLKGAAVAQLAYGTLALKQTKDIDFLIPPERARDAFRLLEKDGYVLHDPAADLDDTQWHGVLRLGSEVLAAHPTRRLEVELRWRVSENMLMFKGVNFFANTIDVALSEGHLRTFDENNQFAYLCVHGARHGWCRLKWLTDLNALLAGKSAQQIRQLYAHAQAIGSGLCAGLALLLCKRFLALQLPSDLEPQLRRSWRLAFAERIALNLMIGPRPEVEPTHRPYRLLAISLIVLQFLLGSGWRYFFRQVWISSVRLGDVISVPLPSRLYFLYPLLRGPLWIRRMVSASSGNTRHK